MCWFCFLDVFTSVYLQTNLIKQDLDDIKSFNRIIEDKMLFESFEVCRGEEY
jgi:hypothetical protein